MRTSPACSFPWPAGSGVYGIGAAAAGLAMLLAQVRRSDLRDPKIWAMCGYGAMLLFGLHAQRQLTLNNYRHEQPPLSVALLQGNIPQDEKFQSGTGIPLALQWYSRQLYASQADLTLAPETAIPLLPQQLSPGYLDGLRSRFSTWGDHRAALVGMPLGNAAQATPIRSSAGRLQSPRPTATTSTTWCLLANLSRHCSSGLCA